jgi:phosphatidylinositol-bisphosphatase
VRAEVLRELDALENSSIPELDILPVEYSFDRLRYLEPQRLECTIRNTGKAAARWSIAAKPDTTEPTPPWLRVVPSRGIVGPGDVTTIKLLAHVDERSAASVNGGAGVDDILILRIENGRDYFLLVSGSFVRTFFCMPLGQLVHMQSPAVQVPPGLVDAVVDPMRVPKELWRLVDVLARRGAQHENLFMLHGRLDRVAAIRAALDSGESFPEGVDLHSAAEVLIKWLQSLPDPVVPRALYKRCVENASSRHQSNQLVLELGTPNKLVFQYLMSFLRERLSQQSTNKSSPEGLAFVFGRALMAPPTAAQRAKPSVAKTLAKKQAAFLLHFLVDE